MSYIKKNRIEVKDLSESFLKSLHFVSERDVFFFLEIAI